MSWAMKVGGFRARSTDTRIKTAIRTRMMPSCFLSSISGMTVSLRRSRVSVELEVSTREDRVDMEAESTRTMTIPIRRSGRVESIWGMMLS